MFLILKGAGGGESTNKQVVPFEFNLNKTSVPSYQRLLFNRHCTLIFYKKVSERIRAKLS